jgi:hypothetical protein
VTYISLAARALEQYLLDRPEVVFIRHNENITFRMVEPANRAQYLLRIHSPISANYAGMRQHPSAVLSELRWIEALGRDTPLTVQQPVLKATLAMSARCSSAASHYSSTNPAEGLRAP